MAHFQGPPNGELGEYDVDSKLAVGSIWRMRVAKGTSADVALWGGAQLVVRSNNPTVVGNPLPERSVGNLRVLKLKGQSVGTTMIEAGTGGAPWVSLQVQVVDHLESPSTGDGLITLSKPHMALNAHNTPVVYQMQHSRRIAPGTSAEAIVAMVKQVGRLKHLVFSAHGYVAYNRLLGGIIDSQIACGAGFNKDNVGLFAGFRESVSGGIVWLGSCAIGNDNERNVQRASLANCYLVAPVQWMIPKPGRSRVLPYGKMDMYARYQPKVFAPTGELISWGAFVKMGRQLGFRPS
jgi:hypothetical protein